MKKGIQLNEYGDLNIANGSLVVGETLYQNQYLVLICHKGEIKHSPTLGAGLEDILNDDDFVYWKKEITNELAKDGMQVKALSISTSGINLQAE